MVKLTVLQMLVERNLTSRDLATGCQITYNTALKLIRNPAQIRLETITKLCGFFDCQPGDLFTKIPPGPESD